MQVIYIHGKGGSAEEAEHYRALFPEAVVTGFAYQAQTPWEACAEFPAFVTALQQEDEEIVLIANSIGAFFSLCALSRMPIRKAYFISPVVNMERLILDMMQWADVTEKELQEKEYIATSFGEMLSWEYLSWVRSHPVTWNIPTEILYGSRDNLQSYETVHEFARQYDATLTVMQDGEHWFHTKEQMQFLDAWILGRK